MKWTGVALVVGAVAGCSSSLPPYDWWLDADGGADGSANAPDLGPTCVPGTMTVECKSDADCNDGDPMTVDSCVLMTTGEFPVGTCLHAGCDGGLDCVNQAVDPSCATSTAGVFYPDYAPLHAPDVPATCSAGFQLGNANAGLVYKITSKTTAGSQPLMIDLDIATYEAPDGVLVTGVDGNCKEYTLFDTCHLKTADQTQSTYTDGTHRPTDIAIRQYHLALRKGTTQLVFDFSQVKSPMYLQALGLCDFNISAPASSLVGWFATIP